MVSVIQRRVITRMEGDTTLVAIPIILVAWRVFHAPLSKCSNENLGNTCKWAPSWAFLLVPFDTKQEKCYCYCPHPCQQSQPHSPPNIVLWFLHFKFSIQIQIDNTKKKIQFIISSIASFWNLKTPIWYEEVRIMLFFLSETKERCVIG